MLSGVGGIQSALYAGFALILSFFNYNNFSSHLASKFYKFIKDEDENKTTSNKGDRRYLYKKKERFGSLVPTKTGNLKEFFMEKLPK